MAHVCFLDLRTQKTSWVSGKFTFFFLKKRSFKKQKIRILYVVLTVKTQLSYEYIIRINSNDASTWIKGILGLPPELYFVMR